MRQDDRTGDMLKEVALAGETIAWREWAKVQMIRMNVQ